MAFFSRLGNILRQSANRQISSELRASPSIFQSIRCMCSAPSTKLFIGGVSYSTDEQSLREAFARYGDVVDARIIMDRETGRSRGFGFITFTSVEEASSAIQALDGQDLHGRRIKVNYANERPRGFGGGGGGGYGNAPYGAGAGGGYGGGYGSSPYGGGSSGGGYGSSPYGGGSSGGGYGSSPYGGGSSGGGYGENADGGGGYGGGSYGAAGNNYSAPDSFGTSGAGGNYGGGSSGGYGVSSGVGAGGDNPGFTSGGYGGNAVDGSGGAGTDPGFAAGYDGSGGPEYGSSGQFDIKESGNVKEDLGTAGDSLDGNYRDDDTDDFAKRA